MGTKCICDNCFKMSHGRGYCVMHYKRWLNHGDPLKGRRPNGMGTIGKDGYRLIGKDGKQVPEQRIVMELILGRPLKADEIVHHKNKNRLDNRPENLEVMDRPRHMKLHTREHVREKCPCAVCRAWRKEPEAMAQFAKVRHRGR